MSAPRPLHAFAIALALPIAAACEAPRPLIDAPSPGAQLASSALMDQDCRTGDVRPSTGAPAEGLWISADTALQHRVAAIIGPALPMQGRTVVLRRVETLEVVSATDTLRQSSDTASARLELVPPLEQPAAAYAVSPAILLAAYEPCSPAIREPLVRYLRRDETGRLLADVLLQRSGNAP